MRTLLKVSMDVKAANKALEDGSFQKSIQPTIDQLNPEAVFFTTDGGRRTAYIFFQLNDPSQIPLIAEPFFRLLNAEIDFKPVMNRDDLAKGLQGLGVKKAA